MDDSELHDDPSADEIAAAHVQAWNAKIAGNIGTPSLDVATRLHDVHGNVLDPQRLWVFPAQPSNGYLDTYFTYMTKPMLEGFVTNAQDGRALLRVHDHDSLAVGMSYDGELLEDPAPSVAPLIPKRMQGQPFYRMLEYFYMLRGMPGVDEIIAGIEARIYRDLSVGFIAERMYCDICDGDMLSWDCWHIPGVEYDINQTEPSDDDLWMFLFSADGAGRAPSEATWRQMRLAGTLLRAQIRTADGLLRPPTPAQIAVAMSRAAATLRHPEDADAPPPQYETCVARIEAGQLLETSLVFKGACPDAAVCAIKARMVASTGRLTQRESLRLQRLEQRVGTRLLDPVYYRRVRSSMQLASSNGKEPGMAQTQKAAPARTSGKRAAADAAADPNADPNAAADSTSSDSDSSADTDVQQALADLSTGLAAGLSGQITALQGEMDAKAKELSDAQDELQELQSGSGGDGDPDTSEDIADQQQTIANLQAELSAMQSEMAALQQSLAAANTAADATGGTSAKTPGTAVDADGNPTAPAGASSDGAATNAATTHTPLALAAAGLSRAAGITSTRLAPVLVQLQLGQIKRAACTDLIRAANQLIDTLQSNVVSLGGQPVRTLRDRNMLTLIAQAHGIPPGEVRVNHVNDTVRAAKEGAHYRDRLLQVCRGAKVRAIGQGTDAERYARLIAGYSIEDLEAEARAVEPDGDRVWRTGRAVIPESAADAHQAAHQAATRETAPATQGAGGPASGNGRTPQGVYGNKPRGLGL